MDVAEKLLRALTGNVRRKVEARFMVTSKCCVLFGVEDEPQPFQGSQTANCNFSVHLDDMTSSFSYKPYGDALILMLSLVFRLTAGPCRKVKIYTLEPECSDHLVCCFSLQVLAR